MMKKIRPTRINNRVAEAFRSLGGFTGIEKIDSEALSARVAQDVQRAVLHKVTEHDDSRDDQVPPVRPSLADDIGAGDSHRPVQPVPSLYDAGDSGDQG